MSIQTVTIRLRDLTVTGNDLHELGMHAEDITRRILQQNGVAFTGRVTKQLRKRATPPSADITADLVDASEVLGNHITAATLEAQYIIERDKEVQQNSDRESERKKARVAKIAHAMDMMRWDDIESRIAGGLNDTQRDGILLYLLACLRDRDVTGDLR